MLQTDVNLLAVLVSAIAYMIIGSIWYSKKVFGNKWMGLMDKTEEQLKGAPTGYMIATFCSIITCYVLAVILKSTNTNTALQGVQTGLWISLGLISTAALVTSTFSATPFRLFLINYGYHIVSMIVAGAILGAWH
jgi:hypothetical protein